MQIRIYVTGIYRSGSTLITRILNNHSRLWVTYDSVHFMRFSYGKYDPIDAPGRAESLIRETHGRIKKRWNMTFDVDAVTAKTRALSEITYRGVYDTLMTELALRYKPGVTGWGEKTNVGWGQIPNFLEMFPDGKAIHVIRDPRDVMCSYREMTYEPGYAYLDSAFASLHALMAAGYCAERFGENNYRCVRYEDMVTDPQRQIRSLCDFVGVGFEADMLDAGKFVDKSGQTWTGDSSFEANFANISAKPIDRWRHLATPVEVFFVELINRPVMPSHGYSLSGSELSKQQWEQLYEILKDPVIHERFVRWLKTGEGVEAYPSDPLTKG